MVAFDTMKDKLLTLTEVRNRVESTEPLNTTFISNDASVYFEFDPGWAIGIEEKLGTESVDAVVRINGVDHQLTKDAVLQAGAAFGIPGKYTSKVPSQLLSPQLNYWFGAGLGETEFNMLTTGSEQRVAAFAKPTIQPFSNLALIDTVADRIVDYFGTEDIYADYKFNHSLARTDIRFIVPEALRVISGGGLADVPAGAVDEWSAGIHLSNSLIGKSQTRIDTYLFRWWCTNGSTNTLPDSGAWSRRGDQDEMTVYEWAAASVDEVLGKMEDQFDLVQALTHLNVGTNAAEIVGEIFDTYKVPVTQRREVLRTLETAEHLNLYVIQNAISQTANDPEASDDRRDKIMRISGALAGAEFNSMKAKIWEEGKTANPDDLNPYLISA